MSAGDDGAPPREPDQGRRESFGELQTRARREAKEEARGRLMRLRPP